MMIPTVTGPVNPNAITGPVLPHEHLSIDLRHSTDPLGVLDNETAVIAELTRARENFGLALVVDQTARGMGRNVTALRNISDKAQVKVVASTGWYYQRFHPAGEPGPDVSVATEILVTELTEGITGSDGVSMFPGVIGEVGTSGEEPSPAERVSLLAAAQASRITGLPVSTHAHLGTGALTQLEILVTAGMDLSRVSIGHQDLIDNPAQHRAIAESGAYVAMDTIGKESYQSDAVRLKLIIALVEAGYAHQILLSNDISRNGYLTVSGGTGYCHALGTFASQLVDAGFDNDTLDLLYRRNALRWLSGNEIT